MAKCQRRSGCLWLSYGDNVTRDGHHLSHNLGRYTAGLTWFHKITGDPIDEITWVPNKVEINPHVLEIAKEAVKAAVANPLEITQLIYIKVNLKYFVASKRMFTKEELPVGTIIEVDQGYSYRPEGWVNLER